MANTNHHSLCQQLRERVEQVATLHRRCAIQLGTTRLLWSIGLPLLAVLIIDMLLPLHVFLRAAALPATGLALLYFGWCWVIRALGARMAWDDAAVLVEAGMPELGSRLISALQLQPSMDEPDNGFSRALVGATIIDANRRCEGLDFIDVIDQHPAKRHTTIAMATMLMWILTAALAGPKLSSSMDRLLLAWQDLGDIARQMAGAELVVEAPSDPAFLVGSDVPLTMVMKGFHKPTLDVHIREEGQTEWAVITLDVPANGRCEYLAENCQRSFELFCVAGQIRSKTVQIEVTERPRIARLRVEYTLPAYVRRPPIVQPRSDGNLKAVFGSSILITVEASKTIAQAEIKLAHDSKPLPLSVGGEFAQGTILLDKQEWLGQDAPIASSYTIRLTDSHGFVNENADESFTLEVIHDQLPRIDFVGLPHRSSADEPHILASRMSSISLAVRGKDDFGINKVTLHYRIEALDTGRERASSSRALPFGQPRTEINRLPITRLSQLGAEVGDRVVFWAEATDAYDLEPDAVRVAKTPVYRIAVVTEEELFSEIRYADDWSTQWYDGIKRASLAQRGPPPKVAPEGEPAAQVAAKLLQSMPASDAFSDADSARVRNYFQSLSSE